MLKRARFLQDFSCLGAQCEDTCCRGWSMQVDAGTAARYRETSPELAATLDIEAGVTIMKRDSKTDHCVHYDGGLCGIHASKGTEFLGDACHFFPRITRKLGDITFMTAAPSCPEVARLALLSPNGFEVEAFDVERLPYSLKEYLPDGLSTDDAFTIHTNFVNFAANHTQPDMSLAIISSVARSLQMLSVDSWAAAANFYLHNAQNRLPQAEPHPEDLFHVLHALSGLVDAAPKSSRTRLEQTISECQSSLKITLHRGKAALTITEASIFARQSLATRWKEDWQDHFQPILARWIALQLSESFFPYSGFGATLEHRVTLLGLRYALVKLGLMAACDHANGIPSEFEIIRVIQSLSRFMDHLGDPELSLRICQETGWNREPRLLSLIFMSDTLL
jgi:lysine-N-methylase